jgi:hypothetical protein
MALKKTIIPLYILYIIIIAMATCPAFAIKDGRPALLNTLMMFSPLILFFIPSFYKQELILILFLITILLFPPLFHLESLRWSTIFYSFLFCMTFMAYRRVLDKSGFTIEQYLRLIKFIIYAYFVALLIQQFCVLTGLPIFLVHAYSPVEPWKLNSLSMEPSHTARFIPLLMYCFITIKEQIKQKQYDMKTDFKGDKYIWIAFLWTMVTMGSGTAFLFIPIVLLKFIRGKNILYMVLLALLLWFAANQISPKTFQRTTDTFLATLTLDENKIIAADGSAASRIVPLIVAVKKVGLLTFDDWFGHGIDYTRGMYDILGGGYEDSAGGAMFYIWLEYGFFSFLLFALFSVMVCWRKNDFLSVIFWFMLVFMYGVNNQMVWICIILLYTNKIFIRQRKIIQ